MPEAFPPLTCDELQTEWGKEMRIGQAFAMELDLYRAITCYKRAMLFCPPKARRLQIQYCMLLCYYLGGKYQDAADVFWGSKLDAVPEDFPGFRTLIIVLYDCYKRLGDNVKACKLLMLLEQYDPEAAHDLMLSAAFLGADFEAILIASEGDPREADLTEWINCFLSQTKSVKKAQYLNAILPGAGYAYLGQTRTAATAFIINALFIAAAYEFFHHHDYAAGIITTSLELGWYVGGINGAGLAAKSYNEGLYNTQAKEVMMRNRLFPVLMFQRAF
jgi:hypothetical protein